MDATSEDGYSGSCAGRTDCSSDARLTRLYESVNEGSINGCVQLSGSERVLEHEPVGPNSQTP